MTVIVKIGRRVPKNAAKRLTYKLRGLLSFQENMWLMITGMLSLAKRRAMSSDTGISFVKTKLIENEDLFYCLEWVIVHVQGTPEQEEEEYNESLDLYKDFKKIFKKDALDKTNKDTTYKDPAMKAFFKTTHLTSAQLEEAYNKGLGSVSDSNIANKLLELGILTHVEWLDDFSVRGIKRESKAVEDSIKVETVLEKLVTEKEVEIQSESDEALDDGIPEGPKDKAA